ncbi:hypothetical protein [Pyruvatibacter sp.]
MRIVTTKSVVLNGQTFGPGWPFENLTELEAKALVDAGEARVEEAAAPTKPNDADDLNAAIIAAMEGMAESDISADGKPNVKPLGKLLGYSVTADERDAALEALKALLA